MGMSHDNFERGTAAAEGVRETVASAKEALKAAFGLSKGDDWDVIAERARSVEGENSPKGLEALYHDGKEQDENIAEAA
jgi:hypothetical protein